ncbi:MAG: phosphoribosylglycinamide formyltransferase [Actinomycetota bacterium]|nr:phosphoribosylglycinamide formyltransferase [Actinomycetota bacterium]
MAGRLVVLISGTGSAMEALAVACTRRQLAADIAAVIADRDCFGLKVAAKKGIPAFTIEPAHFPSRDDWNEALGECVGGFRPHVVVLAGFMRVLAPPFVDAYAGRLINLHPSLLPAFPGAHAVRDALDTGVKLTGTTIHFVDHEVDHGPILLQEAVRVQAGDTELSLHTRIKNVEHRLLPKACRLILERKVQIRDGVTHVEP